MHVCLGYFDLDALALPHNCFSIDHWNRNFVPQYHVNGTVGQLLIHRLHSVAYRQTIVL